MSLLMNPNCLKHKDMVCFCPFYCHFHCYILVGTVHIQSNIYIYNGQFQDEGVFFLLTIYSMCNIIGITSLWKVYSILHFCVTLISC